MSNLQCNNTNWSRADLKILDSKICAENPGKDACQGGWHCFVDVFRVTIMIYAGDSGGPLALEQADGDYKLIGTDWSTVELRDYQFAG